MFDFLINFYGGYEYLFFNIAINVLLAMSMYITLSAGTFILAHGALMAVGAYVSAIITIKLGATLFLSLAGGIVAALIVAIIITKPALRLAGFYLAIATIALGEAVRYTALNLSITGGALGLKGIPQNAKMWHLLLAIGIFIYLFFRIERSRKGRAFSGIRNDEVASSAIGIDIEHYRMLAIIISAVILAVAGALEAHHTFFVAPDHFGLEKLIHMLSFCVIGGIKKFWGPIAGAVILTVLPEFLRPIGEHTPLFVSIVMLGVILFMPNGIFFSGFPKIHSFFRKGTMGKESYNK
ncbi:MAG: hypothetical protein A2X93_02825 [Deltaproteobacteria bacterium GWC2_56_8]|nr:MAG: hypothetical protein A2X93_02825 [Deltaproteobacteria bacterium GWC2_56_8]